MIDRIRSDMQEYLDWLLAEADRLRRAIAVLDVDDPDPSGAQPASPAGPGVPVWTPPGARSDGRRERGATKAAVLHALDDGTPRTAGQIAAMTGVARPTVSTTLSRLVASGEVVKAERGYVRRHDGRAAQGFVPAGA